MSILILTIHIIIALALVFVILLQRSEGGGLGIGGGGGQGGGFMTARGTANLLTRVTAFLAVAFFFNFYYSCDSQWTDGGDAIAH
jgi:preprotein translocase subunit SecG